MRIIIVFSILCSLLLINSSCSNNSDNANNNSSAKKYPSTNNHHDIENHNQAQTNNNTPSNRSSLSNKENIESLIKGGLEIIENQSFWIEFENWGKVKFISSEILIDGTYKLRFYLTNESEDILYQFPEFIGNDWPTFYEIRAVSFKDINKDGLKDIIIIADYLTGIGEQGAIPFPVGSIYFQIRKKFINYSKLDDQINDSGKNKNIDMIVNFAEGKVSKGVQ